ncbi:MAG: hypothetical protein JXA64_05730 [Candidatus Fermentibacteraceae bacterium]|nr:hypothetical protein [Candidatus Fermentibacteraceae bacterium]MBN2608597.1 hypothetical protein [Candidatus Fermentibacteraceae bacterium]
MSEDFDRKRLKMKSLHDRTCKVRSSLLIGDMPEGMKATEFTQALPEILAVRDMRKLARAIVEARKAGSARILMYGGHVIKCGLGPLLVKWLGNGTVSCLATNGAGTIHDVEMALFGETSEDVEAGIADGSFGMWKETGEVYSGALRRAAEDSMGLGEALGREILDRNGNRAVSPLAAAVEAGAPVTVHPALGGDIVHPYPDVSWGRLAEAAERDFDLLGERIATLSSGVVINAGSAVVMPEVFLKLLTTAINLGNRISGITAASFDMIRQYRPLNNVVFRPSRALGGDAVVLTGHHELMLPLLDIFLQAEEASDE